MLLAGFSLVRIESELCIQERKCLHHLLWCQPREKIRRLATSGDTNPAAGKIILYIQKENGEEIPATSKKYESYQW